MSGLAKRRPVTFDLSRILGAVISGDTLSLVGLAPVGSDRLLMVQHAAWFFLDGRDQDSVATLHHELVQYCKQRHFDAIVIRGAPAGRAFAAKFSAYKIETLLQMLPEISVGIVPTASVIAWQKREDPLLPYPVPGLNSAERRIQERAIEMAMFARERLTQFEA